MPEHDLRGTHRVSAHGQRDRRRGQRPVQSHLLPHLVSRSPHGCRRYDNLRQNLVRLQRDLARVIVLRHQEELRHRNFARPFRRDQLYLRAQRHQRRAEARRPHEISRSLAENRVVFVLAFRDQRFTVLHPQQSEAAAEIPAARPLAQVPAHSPHVADLRTGNTGGCIAAGICSALHFGILRASSSIVASAPMRSPAPLL